MSQSSAPVKSSKALFISDLHLQATSPKTVAAFLQFLEKRASQSEQLYILGDLFEYWVGDDDMDSETVKVILGAIRRISDNGTSVFWISGNRDLLTGRKFLRTIGAKALDELAVVDFGNKKFILAHGDAQCTDDINYMRFRKRTHNPIVRFLFLALPLAKRKKIIAGYRQESKKANESKSANIMDVNASVIDNLFIQTGASVMIHGHTHRPGRHTHVNEKRECVRLVLSDWNLDGDTPRGDWLEVGRDNEITRHSILELLSPNHADAF